MKRLDGGHDNSSLQLAFFFVFLLYNITETAITGLSLMWLVFLLVAVDYPILTPSPIEEIESSRHDDLVSCLE